MAKISTSYVKMYIDLLLKKEENISKISCLMRLYYKMRKKTTVFVLPYDLDGEKITFINGNRELEELQ